MVSSALLVILVIGATAAHPHPDGECSPMASLRRGRHLAGEALAPCMKGLRPVAEQRDAIKYCTGKIRRNHFFRKGRGSLSKDGLTGLKGELRETMAECLVERMDLAAADGSLDVLKTITKSSTFEGHDPEVVISMQQFTRECAENSTSTNATQQMLEIIDCVKEKSVEFCGDRYLVLRSWVDSEGENATCSNVTTPNDTDEAFAQCLSEMPPDSSEEDIPRRRPGRGRGRRRGRGRGRGRRSALRVRRDIDEDDMWSLILCTSEKLGWYNASTGFDFVAYAEHMANFSGWQDIPEVGANLTESIVDCAPEFEGDSFSQAVQWSLCIRPIYMDLCGLRSYRLTEYLFPGLIEKLNKAAVKEILRDMQSDSDEDDVEVDAGLLMLNDDEEDAMVLEGGHDPEAMMGHFKTRESRGRRFRGNKNRSQDSNESKTPDNTSENYDSDEVATLPATTVFP